MKRTFPAGLLALCLSLAAVPALAPMSVDAGVAVRMDLDQLVQRAELVVSGRVLAARAVESPEGRIDTEYELTIDRTFWGEDLGQRTLRMPGGVLPSGRGLMLPGMATLAPGEEVLLLLTDEGKDGLRVPIGLAQGKFRLATTEAGVRVAVRSQAGLELLREDPAPGAPAVQPAPETEVIEYAELAARLETAVARKRARLRGK